MQFNEGNYKKNYFWSKKIKTWEYLSNRKGLQRDLGVLIILRSRLKVWEPDSRLSLWLTESILSSCNSSGPLYLPDFMSWKQCWGEKNLYWASSHCNVLGFSFVQMQYPSLRQDDGKVQVLEGAGTIQKQDPNSGNSGRFKVNSQIPSHFCSWLLSWHAVTPPFWPIAYIDLSNAPE